MTMFDGEIDQKSLRISGRNEPVHGVRWGSQHGPCTNIEELGIIGGQGEDFSLLAMIQLYIVHERGFPDRPGGG